MKTGLILLTAFVSTIVFSSCQREIDWELNTRIQSDSSYLATVVMLDTTLPVGSDTIGKTSFTYDNLKRLSRLYSYNTLSSDTFVYDLKYNNSDSLPSIIIEKGIGYNGPGTYYIDTIYYTYGNSVIINDSSVHWVYPANSYEGSLVDKYLITGNVVKLYVKDYVSINGVNTLANTDSAFYNVNNILGNISSQTRLDGGASFYNSVQATYDNKVNPWSKVIKCRYACFENRSFSSWNIQRNNPLTVQYQVFFGISSTEQYSYTYRADGYPLILRISGSGSLLDFNKAIYKYTAL